MTIRLAVLLAAGAHLAGAASPTAWELNTYDDFRKGRLSGVMLSREGRLRLAPRLETFFSSEQPVVWSVAQVGGDVYLGTGHRGRVYRVDTTGRSETVFSADQPEIFALAADAAGRVYAATSPNGKIYRIEKGKAAEFFAPGAKYVWSLALDAKGTLYVGTGDEGKVFRVDAAGRGELYYETGQTHVTSLALDAQGCLLAGTEPNGVLYRVTAKDKAFVLYDANLPEIRSIVAAADGNLYAVAMGGAVARQAAEAKPQASQVVAPATTITVTAQAAQAGPELKPKETPTPAAAISPGAPAAITPAPPLEVAGAEKSALYRILPDNMVETLWTSSEENAYDVVQAGSAIYIATDEEGRVYQVGPDRKVSLVAETRQSEATRLLAAGRNLLVATGGDGKLYRLGESPAETGVFESPVHDASVVARWGRLSWVEENCEGCRIVFRTRAGNLLRPDKTWSEWSDPLADRTGSAISSPNARYVQWKAELTGSRQQSPVLDSVRLSYLPQNRPPKVKSITVAGQTVPVVAAAAKPATPAQSAPAYSITVTETGEAGPTASTGTATQPVTRSAAEQMVISWQTEDPDNDRMSYSLSFRGEEERSWKVLKANIDELTYTLDATSLADGRYYFRLAASDRLSNPVESAREDELVSAPVLVDRTAPVVTLGAPRRQGTALEIEVAAADASSPLRSCEYSIDAGPWTPLAARDGVTDSPREQFLLRLDPVPAGEHLLVLRAQDGAGNAGLARTVLR